MFSVDGVGVDLGGNTPGDKLVLHFLFIHLERGVMELGRGEVLVRRQVVCRSHLLHGIHLLNQSRRVVTFILDLLVRINGPGILGLLVLLELLVVLLVIGIR